MYITSNYGSVTCHDTQPVFKHFDSLLFPHYNVVYQAHFWSLFSSPGHLLTLYCDHNVYFFLIMLINVV